MATHEIPILGHATRPDASGDVFQEPYSIKATNDLWDQFVWIFNDSSTRIGLKGLFRVPQNYVGTAAILVSWTSIATTGDWELDFDYRAVAIGESMDQATAQETVNINDTAPGSVNLFQEASLSLTDANLAAGDLVSFEFFRDGTDAGDTMAAAAIVFGAYFSYADA
ncbi:MAG: hypothetical protein ACR2RF_25070 [Geminicoccaceae bacterium]